MLPSVVVLIAMALRVPLARRDRWTVGLFEEWRGQARGRVGETGVGVHPGHHPLHPNAMSRRRSPTATRPLHGQALGVSSNAARRLLVRYKAEQEERLREPVRGRRGAAPATAKVPAGRAAPRTLSRAILAAMESLSTKWTELGRRQNPEQKEEASGPSTAGPSSAAASPAAALEASPQEVLPQENTSGTRAASQEAMDKSGGQPGVAPSGGLQEAISAAIQDLRRKWTKMEERWRQEERRKEAQRMRLKRKSEDSEDGPERKRMRLSDPSACPPALPASLPASLPPLPTHLPAYLVLPLALPPHGSFTLTITLTPS